MLACDLHAPDAGPDAEAQGRLQLRCFAVDAGGHGMLGFDLESRCRPFPPRSLRQPAARAATGWGSHDSDPEEPVVDPRAGAGADRAAQSVAVVRDQDRGSHVVLVPTRTHPSQVQPGPLGPEHVGHRVEQRPQLRVAVARVLHRVGVEPK
jgi:hypothetical protein